MAKIRKALPELESAGGVVINDDGEVLFCHPTRTRWDNWRMPKGIIDADEDHRKAALREVLEETGYRCKVCKRLKTPTRYRTSTSKGAAWKTLTLFLMSPIEQVQEPDWENDKFKWVPLDKLESYAAKVEMPLIREAIELWHELKK